MRQLIQAVSAFALVVALAACGGQGTQEQAADDAATAASATGATEQPATADAGPGGGAVPPAFAQCASCHSTEPGKNLIGPSLAGIFGTKAGEVAGYNFSTAMKESGLTWDEATLDRYLKAPREVIPGTKMTYPGLKDDAKRAAVVAYLKSLK
jgi:cytochrome c